MLGGCARSQSDDARQEGAARKSYRTGVGHSHRDRDRLRVKALLLEGNGEFIPWALLERARRQAALSQRGRCTGFARVRLQLKLSCCLGRNGRAAAKGDCDHANANQRFHGWFPRLLPMRLSPGGGYGKDNVSSSQPRQRIVNERGWRATARRQCDGRAAPAGVLDHCRDLRDPSSGGQTPAPFPARGEGCANQSANP
jgi:hypothetical protein